MKPSRFSVSSTPDLLFAGLAFRQARISPGLHFAYRRACNTPGLQYAGLWLRVRRSVIEKQTTHARVGASRCWVLNMSTTIHNSCRLHISGHFGGHVWRGPSSPHVSPHRIRFFRQDAGKECPPRDATTSRASHERGNFGLCIYSREPPGTWGRR